MPDSKPSFPVGVGGVVSGGVVTDPILRLDGAAGGIVAPPAGTVEKQNVTMQPKTAIKAIFSPPKLRTILTPSVLELQPISAKRMPQLSQRKLNIFNNL